MGIVSSNKRSFFQNFYSEILTSKQINQQLIKDFAATSEGKGLEEYLKNI